MNELPSDYSQQLTMALERMEGFKASLTPDALVREDARPETLAREMRVRTPISQNRLPIEPDAPKAHARAEARRSTSRAA